MSAAVLAVATEVSPMGDDLPGWLEELRRLAVVEREGPWRLGDHLNEGVRRYGVAYRVAADAAGRQVAYMRNLAWVAKRVPPENRRPDLAWRAHRAVAQLREREQRAWLAAAAEHGWTSTELERELSAAGDAASLAFPNAERTSGSCPTCGRYWGETA
jgi:hypothetical protein